MYTRFFVWLLLAFMATETTTAQPLTATEIDAIDTYMLERVAPDQPGVAYGVVKNGAIVLEKYHGMASLQHQVPVAAATRFNIASVAKQFTALIVLDLVQQGKLALDDDIRQYLPAFYPDIKEPIRIRHLLNHSSGIRDFYDLLSLQQKPWWRQVGMDNDDAMALLEKQKDLNFEPGTAYLYSNSNYTMLTQIVASAAGEPFHSYARSFFERMGMPDTGYNKNYMYVIPHLAYPYSDWGDGIWQQYPHLTNLFGDGFLYTTLPDQLAFELAVQRAAAQGDTLLTTSQQPVRDAEITSYGYGLELENRLGRPAVHHSGATGSSHAQVVRFPEENLSIVVMSNNGTIWSGYIANHIAEVLLPDQPEKPVSQGLADTSNDAALLAPEAIAGEYLGDNGRLIRIAFEEDQVVWKDANNNPSPLSLAAGGVYAFDYTPAVNIGFQTDRMTVYRPGSQPAVYKRMPAFSPDLTYRQGLAGAYYNKEIDVTFRLFLDEDETLMLYNDARDRAFPVEILQKDHLLLSDYMIEPQRNASGEAEALLLTFSRLKNIRFDKLPPENQAP